MAANTEKMTHLSCHLEAETPVQINDSSVAVHLYRIAQEAVANAIKHAQATQIVITLSERLGQIRLAITDNGVGIGTVRSPNGGLGLSIMNSRAETINATLQVRRGDRGGTVVECSVRAPALLANRSASPAQKPASRKTRKGRHGNRPSA